MLHTTHSKIKTAIPLDTEGIAVGLLTVLLHNFQELDDNLGRRSDQDLSFSGLLGIDDVVEAVVENGLSDHIDYIIVSREN